MKLAWLTDIHLNFLDKSGRKKFYQQIVASQVEAVLISGDIAEAPSVSDILKEMIEQIQMPIYFVLGNHCDANYINHLGFNSEDPDWKLIAYDWIHPIHKDAWHRLYQKWMKIQDESDEKK